MKIKGRILAIDYGTKRIGLAISDENRIISRPHSIIANDSNIFKKLGQIIKDEEVSEIVIGDSLDFSGKPNAVSGQIGVFIAETEKKFELPVRKEQEFLTSVEARRSFKKFAKPLVGASHSRVKIKGVGRVDSGAAAIILERYLEKNNKQIK